MTQNSPSHNHNQASSPKPKEAHPQEDHVSLAHPCCPSQFSGPHGTPTSSKRSRAFFIPIIIQFLCYQHRNWYVTQPHNQPRTSNHGAIFPIHWLWQPGRDNQRHSPSNKSHISHPEEKWRWGKNWQRKRRGQSKMDSCISRVDIICSDRLHGFNNNYMDVIVL